MIIRKIQKDDLATRVEWMNNPRIYSSMHYDIPVLLENTISWWENNQTKNNRTDVVIIENEDIVAMAGFTNIDWKIKKAETYLFTNPNKLNTGIGTKAKKMLCEYGFNILGLKKLYFITNEDNYASIRINEKCGFVLEGRMRKEYLTKDGILKDRLYFGLLKEEWNK